MTFRLAIAQLNATVGDFEGNATRILQAAKKAHDAGASLLLTPELALSGYPPEDLLLRPAFEQRCEARFQRLCEQLSEYAGLTAIIGLPIVRDGRLYNAARVVQAGKVIKEYRKLELPNYAVFDEQRYFTQDGQPCVFELRGLKVGINICEDVWCPRAPAMARAAGAQVLVALNASPFHLQKQSQRLDVVRKHVSSQGLPLFFANLVGGQDELVFDGQSFALNAAGDLVAQAPQFDEDLLVLELDRQGNPLPSTVHPTQSEDAQCYGALVLGVRDYVLKNRFPGAIIGLSGGIDSALTLAIAVDALGADKVRAVMMPSPYTADISLIDAQQCAKNLGVRYDVLPISGCFDAFKGTLAEQFAGLAEDTTEENIQARVRGTLLMALSNKTGSIVLTTGNKSELATGYCTLYGDMAGGFAVIKDVYKTRVWDLSRWRNRDVEVIPDRIITRPPTAELRPNQTDQDSLPPYDILDAIIRMTMEDDRGVDEIIEAGFEPQTVRRVVRLLRINEYKRRQAPVGVRVTSRAFGRDWRYPITSRFADEESSR